MENLSIIEKIQEVRIVPVIAIDSVNDALPLADALIEGGLPIIEITFRTQVAASVIGRLSAERPNLILGAGTILTIEHLYQAKENGAQFGVAPGLNLKIVQEAKKIGFPFFPGVMTPTDIDSAIALDAKVLKFFPAEAIGGSKTLKSVSAPYAHLGIKFIPTGGITLDSMAGYLTLPSVCAIGGTWIAPKELIVNQQWHEITKNATEAANIVIQLQSK